MVLAAVCCILKALHMLQGVWAKMSDAVDRTWQILDEDLHREEAESVHELEKYAPADCCPCTPSVRPGRHLKRLTSKQFCPSSLCVCFISNGETSKV